MQHFVRLFIEYDLGDAGAVADVNENQVPKVSAAMHPSHENHALADIARAQFAAIVSALTIAKKIESRRTKIFGHQCKPFRRARPGVLWGQRGLSLIK
jgi:hypothetical protein